MEGMEGVEGVRTWIDMHNEKRYFVFFLKKHENKIKKENKFTISLSFKKIRTFALGEK